jgi:hypothetical protein
MQRPLGVTIIAAIQFFGTAFLITASLVLGTGILGTMLGAGRASALPRFVLLFGGDKLVAVAALMFACFLVTLGYGMWHLKNWARITTLTVEALSAMFAVFGILWALAHVTVFLFLCISIRLGTNLAILWYLSRPQVIRAFVPVESVGPAT